jgi:hypothetical protein
MVLKKCFLTKWWHRQFPIFDYFIMFQFQRCDHLNWYFRHCDEPSKFWTSVWFLTKWNSTKWAFPLSYILWYIFLIFPLFKWSSYQRVVALSICRLNEREQEEQLFIAAGRMQDMHQHFEIVEQQQGMIYLPITFFHHIVKLRHKYFLKASIAIAHLFQV